ncbi:MAG: polymer-forming cytoskeletal protein [Lysobacteraceae bacterium]|jgi:cytoskeletal protein CcmA (bactofilin family)
MIGLGRAKAPASRPGGAVDTLIGPDVVLRGDLTFSGGLYLEGTLFGTARAEDGAAAHLTIAPRGRVEGEVHAPVVVVHGTVVGDIHASERLELGPGARIEGSLHYAVVQMAAGAMVTGRLVHRPKAAAAPAMPVRPREATPA